MSDEMEVSSTECATMNETPNCASSTRLQNSCDSANGDSGYLTLTPRSGGLTPIWGTRSRILSAKRPYRLRADAHQHHHQHQHHHHRLQTAPRLLRSKRTSLINASSDQDFDSLLDESRELAYDEHDSGAYSCELADSRLSATSEHDETRSFRQPDSRDVAADTRDRRIRRRRACAAAVTPAAEEPLSPPPSPAVPSASFVASEPADEDVEMKLVAVTQSTPYSWQPVVPVVRLARSSLDESPSSVSTRLRRRVLDSLDDAERLGDSAVCDVADIKPKRLDFSRRALSYALHRTRATPDYTGEASLDLMSLLGEKSNHWRVVSKILSHLSPQDLCSFSMVSKAWRRICANDSRANTRRLGHIILRQNTKENLKLLKKAKLEGNIATSPKSRYVRKGYLLEVQNFLQVPVVRRPPDSPPVSPSKVKFHSFVKASRTLEPWEHLLPCPSCTFPCHVDDVKNVGKCSRQGCSMEFCTACSSRPHSGPCKTPLLATPTKRNKRLIVGSRQSKRNLRRL